MLKQHEVEKIERQIYITNIVTVSECMYNSKLHHEGEFHNYWELVCVTGGTAEIVAGNSVVVLESGKAILHPPMEFHNLRPVGDSSIRVLIICFYADAMPELKKKIYTPLAETKTELLSLCALSEDIFLLSESRHRPSVVQSGKEAEAGMFVSRLEYLIYRLLSDEASEPAAGTHGAGRFVRILDMMRQNMDKRLTAGELADLCCMSESTMRSVIYKYTGKGAISYFNLMKMKKAITLLEEGYSVKETAFKLGFQDQNYFSTVFKRNMGVSPGRFKRYSALCAE